MLLHLYEEMSKIKLDFLLPLPRRVYILELPRKGPDIKNLLVSKFGSAGILSTERFIC